MGWFRYDGTGWLRLLHASHLLPPESGHEYGVSFLRYGFFFEKPEDGSLSRPLSG